MICYNGRVCGILLLCCILPGIVSCSVNIAVGAQLRVSVFHLVWLKIVCIILDCLNRNNNEARVLKVPQEV
jgi:hypothetical protein